MYVTPPASIDDVVRNFQAGNLPWGEVPDLLMRFIDSQVVDSAMRALPPDIREYFIEHAKVHYVEGATLIAVSSGLSIPTPPSAASLTAVREWLSRNT